MSFWNTSTGESAYTNETSYEMEGGNIEPLPEGSSVLASIDKVKWETVQDGYQKYINIQWTVIEPDTYRNRKVFQKLWVTDLDPGAKDVEAGQKKRDRALRLFAAIDANAGGRLSKINSEPTDDELMFALAGKIMVIGLGLWETNDGKRGNWVRAVSDKTKPLNVPAAPTGTHKNPSRTPVDDSIPF